VSDPIERALSLPSEGNGKKHRRPSEAAKQSKVRTEVLDDISTFFHFEAQTIFPPINPASAELALAAAAKVELAHSETLGSALASASPSQPRIAGSCSCRNLPVCSPTPWMMQIPSAQRLQS
jgi:hypothetical protein